MCNAEMANEAAMLLGEHRERAHSKEKTMCLICRSLKRTYLWNIDLIQGLEDNPKKITGGKK